MTRLSAIVLSAVAAISAVAAPAALQARDSGAFFTVQLAEATTESEAIAGGVVFRCEGTQCTAPRSGDRALRVCSELRREVGTIASFSAGGSMLSESQLSRCNG